MKYKIRKRIEQILTHTEEIEFTITQKAHIFNWIPNHAVITNRRLIIYECKLFGASFHDFLWFDLEDAHLEENIFFSTFSMKRGGNMPITIGGLPKDPARELYRLAQELEEAARVREWDRNIEEREASSNKTVINNASLTPDYDSNPANYEPEQSQLPAFRLKKQLPIALPDHQSNNLSKLQDLKIMLDEDLITQHEYEIKKIEILKQM